MVQIVSILEKLSYEHLTVFAGLNRFKPHVWQKQVFAGRNPTLTAQNYNSRNFGLKM